MMMKQGGSWKHVPLTNYDNEEELRDLLASSPDLVPGCADNLTMTELSVPGAGSADVVLIDESGAITIVEAKLKANREMRREVIGQILAYASGLDGMTFDEFAQHAAKRLNKPLIFALQDNASQSIDPDDLRRRVSDTLDGGKFRLVVAVDEITEELKRIIEYLNVHLSEELSVMALELGVLKLDHAEILVPATYGAEVQQQVLSPGKRRWTREEVEDALKSVPVGHVRDLLEKMWRHAERAEATVKGGVGLAPSAGVYYQLGDVQRSLWSVYFPDDGPRVSLNLGSLRTASEQAAREVLERLRACEELSILLALPEDDETALSKYPSVSLGQLEPGGCGFTAIYEALGRASATNVG